MQIPQAINSYYENLSKDVMIRYHLPAAIISQFLLELLTCLIGKEDQSQSPRLTNMMITSIFVRGTEVSLIGHDTSADLDLGAGREGGLPPQIKWLSPRNSSPPHTTTE